MHPKFLIRILLGSLFVATVVNGKNCTNNACCDSCNDCQSCCGQTILEERCSSCQTCCNQVRDCGSSSKGNQSNVDVKTGDTLTKTDIDSNTDISLKNQVNNVNKIENPVDVNSENVNHVVVQSSGGCCGGSSSTRVVYVPKIITQEVIRPQPVHIHHFIEKLVPKPYPVYTNQTQVVTQHVPIYVPIHKQVAVPIKVPEIKYLTVPIDKPYPVFRERPVYVPIETKVPQPYPVPITQPVQVPYPVHIPVRVEVPRLVPVPQIIPAPQPQTGCVGCIQGYTCSYCDPATGRIV